MQNIWAIRKDDIAAAQTMPNAEEMEFSDDPSEMTVGYGIGPNLPTRIQWQLERIQNQMEGRDRFHMNQGIEWDRMRYLTVCGTRTQYVLVRSMLGKR